MKTTHAILAATAAAATLALTPAHADVDSNCYNEWNAAVITQKIGEKCRFLDAAAAAKIQATQAARMQCATAKATPAEKGEIAKMASAAEADGARRAAQAQCGEMRKAFDMNVSRLAR
jgi:hypothetical protein